LRLDGGGGRYRHIVSDQARAWREDIMATPAGFENKVAFVWKIADKLRGNLKPHEHGSVMLPTLVCFGRTPCSSQRSRQCWRRRPAWT
jgi:hypothetical protein